mmetsp:Transcript_13994/g.32897  ORF Transcript_13994/g.32897 Transcript_13994/m.32897 type:complete len:253 (+) Transcript_13994:262-1020(+)
MCVRDTGHPSTCSDAPHRRVVIVDRLLVAHSRGTPGCEEPCASGKLAQVLMVQAHGCQRVEQRHKHRWPGCRGARREEVERQPDKQDGECVCSAQHQGQHVVQPTLAWNAYLLVNTDRHVHRDLVGGRECHQGHCDVDNGGVLKKLRCQVVCRRQHVASPEDVGPASDDNVAIRELRGACLRQYFRRELLAHGLVEASKRCVHSQECAVVVVEPFGEGGVDHFAVTRDPVSGRDPVADAAAIAVRAGNREVL